MRRRCERFGLWAGATCALMLLGGDAAGGGRRDKARPDDPDGWVYRAPSAGARARILERIGLSRSGRTTGSGAFSDLFGRGQRRWAKDRGGKNRTRKDKNGTRKDKNGTRKDNNRTRAENGGSTDKNKTGGFEDFFGGAGLGGDHDRSAGAGRNQEDPDAEFFRGTGAAGVRGKRRRYHGMGSGPSEGGGQQESAESSNDGHRQERNLPSSKGEELTFQEAYEAFGLQIGASEDQVRKAHRRAMIRLRPDLSPDGFAEARKAVGAEDLDIEAFEAKAKLLNEAKAKLLPK